MKKEEEKLAIAVAALEEILNPLYTFQAGLKPGEKLDGPMALRLVEDPSYSRDIAKRALDRIREVGNDH